MVLIYGGGSVKKNGVYDQVMAILQASGKNVTEDGGVMPNPTIDKIREGAAIAKEAAGKTDRQIAEAGFGAMEDWMRSLGVAMNLTELGVSEEDFDDIISGTDILAGGYALLTAEDIRMILEQSL